ncbi:MAG: efflux RND transporter periplasmic adaptor subunit, partial [Bacteroidetes bacterium]|nr:efflux RND transporter periplasmic adaptor subunit [Bacteroidota bacterium]
ASVSAVEAAKANLNSAQIQLGYTKIYSPINGIIGITKARVGDFVGKDPNPVILNTVSATNNVKVRFYLTETAYLYLSREYVEKMSLMVEGEPDPVREPNIELILSDESIYEEKGTVDFIDRSIDASTGSILIQANFPNPKLILRPGLYAKVKVVARNVKDAILIPQRCIMELQGQHSVYVVNDSNVVESRQLTTGPTTGDYWLIDKGLKANEKVVIDALQRVRPGMKIIPEVIEFESKTNLQ